MEAAQLPPVLLARATGYRVRGKIHFPRELIGTIVPGRDEDFVVFRQMVLDPAPRQHPTPGAILRVRFHFSSLSAAANRRISLLPAPFIAAQPGFLSKTWMLGRQSGIFQGVYEWETAADAEAYWDSFPLRMMRRRAKPDSIEYKTEAL